jgi:hypothetical protein
VCQGEPPPRVQLQFIVNKGGACNRVGKGMIPCTSSRDQTVTLLLSSLTGREAFRHVYAGVARGVKLGRSAALSLPATDDHCGSRDNFCGPRLVNIFFSREVLAPRRGAKSHKAARWASLCGSRGIDRCVGR